MKIAISGKMGSGKSTLAEHLCTQHGFDIFAFAYNLKLDVINMGIPAWIIMKKPTPPWLRKLLQLYGESKRSRNMAYWVDRLHRDVLEVDPEHHVIEDMRYDNEASWAKSQGYKLVRVVKLGEAYTDQHGSETELDTWEDWDLVIEVAPGNLVDMYDIIDDELEKWDESA